MYVMSSILFSLTSFLISFPILTKLRISAPYSLSWMPCSYTFCSTPLKRSKTSEVSLLWLFSFAFNVGASARVSKRRRQTTTIEI